MIDIKVDVDFKDAEVRRAMSDTVDACLLACGMKAEEYAKRELNGDFGAPRRIDTGNLRNSVTHTEVDHNHTIYVGTDVEYGPYVHEGTSKMAPNRFLRNAIERNQGEYEQIFKDALK